MVLVVVWERTAARCEAEGRFLPDLVAVLRRRACEGGHVGLVAAWR